MLNLTTKNCIITGHPATWWGGYVTATLYNGQTIPIIAGWKDLDTHEAQPLTTTGYRGQWKESDGINEGHTVSQEIV